MDYSRFHLIEMLQRLKNRIHSLKRIHADGEYYIEADKVIRAINELISELKGEQE